MTDFKNIENYESDILNDIDKPSILGSYNETSLMSREERQFVNGIIRKLKPKKMLEVGVASGSGSVLLLNAIKDIPEAHLYSIDYLEKWWIDNNKDIGFLVSEEFPELLEKWTIYRGGVAAKFLETIGGDIDVCMLDTMHMNPGEILDFLTILPFMKKNGILIIHDIQIHIYKENYVYNSTCCNLLSSLRGKPFFPSLDIRNNGFPNIGAIILDDNAKDYVINLLLSLTMRWNYQIKEEDHNYILKLLKNYYDESVYKQYEKIYEYNNIPNNISNDAIDNTNTTNKTITNIPNYIINLDCKFNRFIDSIAWWIPVKKWR
ncbi:class I SAM-dependent methyltransferase, partial [Brachyspira intermedia]|uniref:class I SAM-dependent methyltransferase n=1 Tax=Brachyspira intermedia TaxID=84377 RepID=UPI003007F129